MGQCIRREVPKRKVKKFFSCRDDLTTKTSLDAAAGPKRIEKSRIRQAPYYRVDKDHEGAENKKSMSQQGFLSETPGYEDFGHDDDTQKSPTKR